MDSSIYEVIYSADDDESRIYCTFCENFVH